MVYSGILRHIWIKYEHDIVYASFRVRWSYVKWAGFGRELYERAGMGLKSIEIVGGY